MMTRNQTPLLSQETSFYQLSIESARIKTTKNNGQLWDQGTDGSEAPDTYIEIQLDDKKFRTPVIANSFQPVWVGSFELSLPYSPSLENVIFCLKDRDSQKDDIIGEQVIDLYEVLQQGGRQTFGHFGQVEELTLSVKALSKKPTP